MLKNGLRKYWMEIKKIKYSENDHNFRNFKGFNRVQKKINKN
jgi:hypothetical protein